MADSGAHQRPDSEDTGEPTGLPENADTASDGQPRPKTTKGRAAKLTPMMQRYTEVKGQNPEAVLLFRMGDFYELFFEDAEVVAPVLGLTLTSRDKNSDNPVPMAGFPYHALDGYLQKLIRAGYRVAICDQVEDPKTAKGMVRREVTQTVTPGTLTDPALLDPRAYNYIAGVASTRDGIGLAWLELSTGRFQATTVTLTDLSDELARLSPAECVVCEDTVDEIGLGWLADQLGISLAHRAAWQFGVDACRRTLLDHFGTRTLEGFDFSDDDIAAATAAGRKIAGLGEILANTNPDARDVSRPWLLSPIDLHVVKAAGVTFPVSMLERIIEERARGEAQDKALRAQTAKAVAAFDAAWPPTREDR